MLDKRQKVAIESAIAGYRKMSDSLLGLAVIRARYPGSSPLAEAHRRGLHSSLVYPISEQVRREWIDDILDSQFGKRDMRLYRTLIQAQNDTVNTYQPPV